MARIPLPTRDSMTDAGLQQRWDRLAARGSVINIYRLFMVNPAIELNARRLWDASGLEPRSREILILRVAFSQHSTYEWHQHVRIARQAGLTAADINAVRDWRASSRFSDSEQALLAYVDELVATPRPSDAVYEPFARNRRPDEIVATTYLVTVYMSLARLMASMDLETEEPFVGWEVSE